MLFGARGDGPMPQPVNDAQKAVLAWLCSDQLGPPPAEAWKISASALASRGLIRVSRPGGRYTATPTEKGIYFHEHGAYPPEPVKPKPPPPPKLGRATKPKPEGRANSREPVEPPSPDPAVVIENPHPAVRSLMSRPVALPDDEDARQRAFVAAHLLVEAAKAAGLKIEGHTQPKKRDSYAQPYRGEPLVTLDAGRASVRVHIGECQQRVDHVETVKEKEDKKQYRYVWAPRYDYVPTGLLCFRLYGGGRSGTRLLETSRRPLSSFVERVVEFTRQASADAIEAEQRRQEREREWAEQARRAQILADRRLKYEQWERSLHQQVEAWESAARLRGYLDVLNQEQGEQAREFIHWATGYVDELDPAKTLHLPAGDVPDLSHTDRFRFGRPGGSGGSPVTPA